MYAVLTYSYLHSNASVQLFLKKQSQVISNICAWSVFFKTSMENFVVVPSKSGYPKCCIIIKLGVSLEVLRIAVTLVVYGGILLFSAAPIVTSAGFDLWIIGVILGAIVLLIVIFFIICTLYRNRGGEYPGNCFYQVLLQHSLQKKHL